MNLRERRRKELERVRNKRAENKDKEARIIALAEKLHVKIGGGHGKY